MTQAEALQFSLQFCGSFKIRVSPNDTTIYMSFSKIKCRTN